MTIRVILYLNLLLLKIYIKIYKKNMIIMIKYKYFFTLF